MRHLTWAPATALALVMAAAASWSGALAQSAEQTPSPSSPAAPAAPAAQPQPPPAAAPSTTAAPPAATAAQPQPAPSPSTPAVAAKDLDGVDVFGSEGQQVGKVAKVNVLPDGNVKDVEVKSQGFLGFFKTTYLIPADKLNRKGGRVELLMTSEQAKQLAQ